MRSALIVCAIAALLLAGCGGRKVDRGVALGGHFYPAHSSTVMIPIFTMVCTTIGSSQSCNSVLLGIFPFTDSYPDQWTATVLRCWDDAKCKTAELQITKQQFERLKIGDWIGPADPAHRSKIRKRKES